MDNSEKILELIKEENPDNPLRYVNNIVKPLMKEKINSAIITCSECPISNKLKTIIKGDVRSSVLVIGERVLESQLGLNKDLVYPFEGTEEEGLLKKLYAFHNINEDHVMYINAVNCLPYKEIKGESIYRVPTREEICNCKFFLEKVIEAMQPLAIILLGNIPFNVFFNGTIKREHGKQFAINRIATFPVYSPSFILQLRETGDDILKNQYEIEFSNDFKKAFEYVQKEFGGNVIFN